MRADIFSAAGLFGSGRWKSCASTMGTSSSYTDTVVFIPIDQNICEAVFQNKVQKIISGMGNRPALFGVVVNEKSTVFCNFLESLVVVGAVSAGVFDLMEVAVVVNHFVKQSRADMFDGSGKGSGSDIDFVGSSIG